MSINWRDSTTYQLILSEGFKEGEAYGSTRGIELGRLMEAQSVILTLGGQRFGASETSVQATVSAITDRDRLNRMIARLLSATDWNDLLATP